MKALALTWVILVKKWCPMSYRDTASDNHARYMVNPRFRYTQKGQVTGRVQRNEVKTCFSPPVIPTCGKLRQVFPSYLSGITLITKKKIMFR